MRLPRNDEHHGLLFLRTVLNSRRDWPKTTTRLLSRFWCRPLARCDEIGCAIQRLGGTRTIKADVHVIAATNRDAKLAMERGTFRDDLYYRLSVFEIALPPLRERKDDILPVARAFLEEIGASIGRPA